MNKGQMNCLNQGEMSQRLENNAKYVDIVLVLKGWLVCIINMIIWLLPFSCLKVFTHVKGH